jgi:hypothetical protein
VVINVVASGADWVTSSAVRAEDWGVAVQACEVLSGAAVLSQTGSVEHVVGLVGGVLDIAPEESGSDYMLLASSSSTGRGGRDVLALPAAELLSMPEETNVQPPGPPRISPAT